MKAIIAPLDVILRWALVVLAVFMVLTVTWQVFSRYVLQAPSSLTEEIARFQLIWLGLLGAVYTFRNRMHMMGVPIAVSIALASVSTLMLSMSFDPAMTTMAQRLAGGLDSFTLLAIPFFVISGYLMGRGGIAKRLIEAAKALVGTLPGGLALVNTLSCMLFGSISGSAVAATSAIGTFMIPTMEKEECYRRHLCPCSVSDLQRDKCKRFARYIAQIN